MTPCSSSRSRASASSELKPPRMGKHPAALPRWRSSTGVRGGGSGARRAHESIGQGRLRRASARSSAPSSMLLTASARPRPAGPDRAGGTLAGRVGVSIGGAPGDEGGGAVTSAGTSAMVASSVKRRRPRSRATIEASTRRPSDGRLVRWRSPTARPAGTTAPRRAIRASRSRLVACSLPLAP